MHNERTPQHQLIQDRNDSLVYADPVLDLLSAFQ